MLPPGPHSRGAFPRAPSLSDAMRERPEPSSCASRIALRIPDRGAARLPEDWRQPSRPCPTGRSRPHPSMHRSPLMSSIHDLGLSETYGAFIDNAFQPVDGPTFEARHSGTGEQVARIARCGAAEVDAAVRAAARAFPAWRATAPEERSALLLKLAAAVEADHSASLASIRSTSAGACSRPASITSSRSRSTATSRPRPSRTRDSVARFPAATWSPGASPMACAARSFRGTCPRSWRPSRSPPRSRRATRWC